MGLFDRFTSKKPVERTAPAAATESSPAAPEPAAEPGGAVPVKPRLAAAREKLAARDRNGALAIYDAILASAGDRADVLVTISGDLGAHGHVADIIELIAPRYDAERHGPATGLNLLQAYLSVRNPDAAQHVLDILFSLRRPELEERLHGFSNAIAEMLTGSDQAPAPESAESGAPQDIPKVGLVTISKPIWFYGLEPLAAQLLPPKEGRLRRIAFAQLALPGLPDVAQAIERPEDELGRLSRALPLWFAETFFFSANYEPVAAIGIVTPPEKPARYMVFGAEWTVANLRQLVDTTQGGLDYIVTGALRVTEGDYDLVLRVYEVNTYRERKKFAARWTPATADAELARLHAEVRRFMEWSPGSAALAYTLPAAPRAWVETLGASVGLFVAEKSVIAPDVLPPVEPDLAHAARHAGSSEVASLAFLTLRTRAARLGFAAPAPATWARSSLVQQAVAMAGS